MAKPIKIEIIGDDKSFGKAMGRVETGLGGLTNKISGFAVAAGSAFAAAGIANLGAEAVGLASDLGEAAGAAETIFGQGFSNLESVLSDSAKSMGLNRVEALDLANGYGVLFGHLTDAERATATLDATARAADVGSMFNDDPAAVAAAFTSAINGSSETVRKYGIDTSDAALKQYALEEGIGAANGALTEAEKKFIRHKIIMRDSEIAAGNFADTSGGLANQQRILSAQFDEVKIKLGEKLLPVVVGVAGFMLDNFLPTVTKIGGYLEDTLGPVINTVADFFKETLVPNLQGASITMSDDLQPTVEALADWWENGLHPALQSVAKLIREDVVPLLLRIAEVIRDHVAPFVLQHLIPAFLQISEFVLGTLVPAFLDLVGFVLNHVVPAFEEFVDQMQTTWDTAVAVKDGIVAAWDAVVTNVTGLPDRITNAVSGLWDGIRDGFATAINWIIDRWNNLTFESPSIAGFGGVTLDTPDIDRLRLSGGLSANIPDGYRSENVRDLRSNNTTVNVNVESSADPYRIANEVAWHIRTGSGI